MQLYPILVVAVILIADAGLAVGDRAGHEAGWPALAAAVAPVALLLLLAALVLSWCMRRMTAGRAPRSIVTADRMIRHARWLILLIHAVAVLLYGWLQAVRDTVGDLILVDEFIAMLPPILGAAALWWLHYPVERRVREALLIRRIDLGQPIHAIPSRWRYVFQQTRLNLLLLLVPILIILALAEALHLVFDGVGEEALPRWLGDAATFVVGLSVFLCAPLLARLVLSLRPLGAGPVRNDLLAICRRHGVRVRQVLLWNTDGAMINAAVMGLLGSVRFVLMTDALIETLTRGQVQAVMAHEIGHVKRHHMLWLVLSLIAALLVATVLVSLPLAVLPWPGAVWSEPALSVVDGLVTAVAGTVALIAFGWISRRYERQADTFAVQHLSVAQDGEGHDSDGRITAEAVAAMNGALDVIARLNIVDPHRKSWRHGSIAWRQRYLASIVGGRADALSIDRLVRRLKLAAALGLLLGAAGVFLLEWHVAATGEGAGEVPAVVGVYDPAGGAADSPLVLP